MKKVSQWIMGKNCLLEVLKHCPERLLEVFVGISKKTFQNDSLFLHMRRKNVPFRYVSKEKLFSFVKSDSHQGIIAKVTPRKFWDLQEFLSHKKTSQNLLLVMLDSIFDPQNMGAILRSCECLGVDGVIFSKNRGVDITPVVTKTSAGASELVNLIQVSNLTETARKLKNADFCIFVADMEGESITKEREPLIKGAFPERSLVIVGSEGRGVQRLLKETADQRIRIPMKGKIESLNVAQATAIILANFSLKE